MLARAVLNNMPLGLNVAEYIYKFLLGEPKNVMVDMEATEKNLFNNINSMEPKVLLTISVVTKGTSYNIYFTYIAHSFVKLLGLFTLTHTYLLIPAANGVIIGISVVFSSGVRCWYAPL